MAPRRPRPARPKYVLHAKALRLIAETDPTLVRTDGEPNLAAISLAAGLDSTTLLRVNAGSIALSAEVMASLATLYMSKRRIDRATAEKQLFNLVAAGKPARVAAVTP